MVIKYIKGLGKLRSYEPIVGENISRPRESARDLTLNMLRDEAEELQAYYSTLNRKLD